MRQSEMHSPCRFSFLPPFHSVFPLTITIIIVAVRHDHFFPLSLLRSRFLFLVALMAPGLDITRGFRLPLRQATSCDDALGNRGFGRQTDARL